MDKSEAPRSKTSVVIKKIFRILLIIAGSVLGLVLLLLILIQFPFAQNIIRKQVQSFVSEKIDTRFEIGRLHIGFPNDIAIEDIYMEDQSGDTLLHAGMIGVNISLFKIINGDIILNKINLEDVTAKVNRTLPDTVFNFQYIINAFSSEDTTANTDTSATNFSIKNISLKNVRAVYVDAITGNDINAFITEFKTDIDEFDLNNMVFDVSRIELNGLNTSVIQSKPLLEATTANESQEPDNTGNPDIKLGPVLFSDINLNYDNEISDLHAKINLAELELRTKTIDLNKLLIEIDKLELNDTYAGIRMGNSVQSVQTEEKIEEEAKEETEKGWKIFAGEIRLNNNHLQFDDDKSAPLKEGIDFAHLNAQNLSFHINDLKFASDTISGNISEGKLTEKSGLVLNRLETDFFYSSTSALLENLFLETPGTVIKDKLVINYPSLDAISSDPGKVNLDINLTNSKVQVKDILYFAPDLKYQPVLNNPDNVLAINTRLKGKVSDLSIDNFKLTGAGNTVIDIHGKIGGLPEISRLHGDLVIREIRTTAADLNRFLPKGSLPDSITLPQYAVLKGRFKGTTSQANLDLNLNTSLGDIIIDGTFANLTDSVNAAYALNIAMESLELGTILQNDTLYGPATAKFNVTGKGYSFDAADADFSGGIISAVYKGYNYKDFEVKGRIEDRIAAVAMNMNDPNLNFFIRAFIDLRKEYPGLFIEGFVDSLRADELNLSSSPLFARTTITGEFATIDPRGPDGHLFITNSLIQTNDRNIGIDSVKIHAGKNDSGNFVNVQADFLTAILTGKFNILQMGDVIYDAIQPYFEVMTEAERDSIDDYDFRMEVLVQETPMLKEIVPAISRLDDIRLNSHFVRNEGWDMQLELPALVMNTTSVRNLNLHAGTNRERIELTALVEQVNSGNIKLYNTSLFGNAADNEADISLGIQDAKGENRYKIAANINTPEYGQYKISLVPDSLLLNYEEWNVPENNEIIYSGNDIHIKNLDLNLEGQHLIVNSNTAPPNSPMMVNFQDFQIGTLTSFINPDTILADGKINGEVVVYDLLQHLTFTTALDITDFSLKEDTVGNLNIKIDNTTEYHFDANIELSGRGNEVEITGTYTMIPEENPHFDMDINIGRLPMETAEALSMNMITKTSGFINGNLSVLGHLSDPDVSGELKFNQAKFNLTMLGADFAVDNETIAIAGEGIRFNNFELKDSTGNILSVDGIARTQDFTEYDLDLNIKADNFQAMNSTKKQNDLFYGRLFFNTNLHVTGNATSPKVNGSLRINDNTNFTIVLPENDPGVADREGIVRFVDMDSIHVDSAWVLPTFDELNSTELRGLELAVNIEIDKDAIFNMIIDEGNGDFISMQGIAELSANIDQSGKVSLTGSYEIEEGEYRLSYNFIKRNFSIQKGSRIVWLGDPTEANVDVTAIYVAETSPLPLVENQTTHTNTNYYKQELPFNIMLKLGGELLKPEVSFDITLPEENNYNVDAQVISDVETKLTRLRSEPSEMNKQVFAILLLNRFVAENPFESGGDGLNAGTLARQSVSKILTQELNNLTSSLVSGVDINFDVDSREDYSTGRRENRTDLNMSLSKQLLNDRLRVTVGSNFNLEGPQQSKQRETNLAGNIAVDYLLSKDGRYLLRAYRENEYTGIIEGYIIETGLSFVVSLDYERFRDLFRKKKKTEDEE